MLCWWACLGHWQRSSWQSLLKVWPDHRIEGPLVAGIGSDTIRIWILSISSDLCSLICFALLDLWYLCYYNDSFITHTNRYVHLHLWFKGEDRSVLICFFFFHFPWISGFRFRSDAIPCFFVCSGNQRSRNWKIKRVWICDLRHGTGDERRYRRYERPEPRRP